MADQDNSSVDLAANLTIAWLNNPNVRANTEDATKFLESMHATLSGLGSASGNEGPNAATGEPSGDRPEPAVTVRKSLASPERIISLIDGKPYTTLKRHLGKHGLTPQQYRERYGLKADYPMVAPAYAEKRRALAKQIGLGRKGAQARGKGRKAPARSRAATSEKG